MNTITKYEILSAAHAFLLMQYVKAKDNHETALKQCGRDDIVSRQFMDKYRLQLDEIARRLLRYELKLGRNRALASKFTTDSKTAYRAL